MLKKEILLLLRKIKIKVIKLVIEEKNLVKIVMVKMRMLCKTKLEISQLFKLDKSLNLIFDLKFLIFSVGNDFYLEGQVKIKPHMQAIYKLRCSNC